MLMLRRGGGEEEEELDMGWLFDGGVIVYMCILVESGG